MLVLAGLAWINVSPIGNAGAWLAIALTVGGSVFTNCGCSLRFVGRGRS